MKSAEKRIGKILEILEKEYPRAKTALRHENPFQLLVATILAAQCTDERVNRVTEELFSHYRGARGMARARIPVLERKVKSTGFYRNKAKNIKAAAGKIARDFGGEVPDTMEELVSLPGVARKTANIVLSTCFGKAEGIAVDTHVKRVAGRLGLTGESNPDKIERDLMELVDRKRWLTFPYRLGDHGRKVCTSRKPDCPRCPLLDLCPSAPEFHPGERKR